MSPIFCPSNDPQISMIQLMFALKVAPDSDSESDIDSNDSSDDNPLTQWVLGGFANAVSYSMKTLKSQKKMTQIWRRQFTLKLLLP